MSETPCDYCGEEIKPEELIGVSTNLHHPCRLRMVIGSAGHILEQCPCYGGTMNDPPELTKREAARLAVDLYLEKNAAEMILRLVPIQIIKTWPNHKPQNNGDDETND